MSRLKCQDVYSIPPSFEGELCKGEHCSMSSSRHFLEPIHQWHNPSEPRGGAILTAAEFMRRHHHYSWCHNADSNRNDSSQLRAHEIITS